MARFEVPFNAWYGDDTFSFELPDFWNVKVCRIADAPCLTDDEVQRAFDSPVGTKRLAELARGRRNAAVFVEDMTRPTPTARIMPLVLRELQEGGIPPKDTVVVMATASHAAMKREDLVKKLGDETWRTVEVLNHNCYENLVDVGRTSFGTPVLVNRFVMDADLKVGVGGVYPHGEEVGGLGGGAKLVCPGIVGIETIESFHSIRGFGNGRKAAVEMGRMIGVDFMANAAVNSRREIAALFTGDLEEMYRKAADAARRVYAVKIPEKADLALTNGYPLDTELGQAMKALGVGFKAVKDGGVVVLTAGCREGVGFHSLMGKGGRWWSQRIERSQRAGRSRVSPSRAGAETRLIVFSPSLTPAQRPDGALYNSWPDLRRHLEETFPDSANVSVFPTGTISVAEGP
ncbi:MAG: lactate racemase domain-containing protein [Candidatus Bathyarchaeia archaeon]